VNARMQQDNPHLSQGVTLVELMVAMSIFSVLGLFLFTLTKGSLDIYQSVRSSGEFHSNMDQVLLTLEDDLICTWSGDGEAGGAPAWFFLTHDRQFVVDEGEVLGEAAAAANVFSSGDPRSLLLCFTRTFPGGELNNTASRFAGTYTDGQVYMNGFGDVAKSRAAKLRRVVLPSDDDEEDPIQAYQNIQPPGLLPPGGLQEVAYFLQGQKGEIPGLMTLYRATRSPVGGAGSLGAPTASAQFSNSWIQQNASPITSGIIWFGLVCWSQHTRSWEEEKVLDGQGLGRDGPTEWAELWWDSTRARHGAFGLHRGASSANNPEDDVFPRRVRLVVTLARDGDAADARLAGRINASTRLVRITNVEALDPDDVRSRYLRIGNEWMEVLSVSGSELTVARGVRSSGAVRHENGEPVLIGRTFVHDIEIPASRAYFQGPGEAR